MSRHCSSVKSVGYDPSGMTCRSSLRSLRTSRQHAESTIHQIKCLVIIIVLNLANLVTDMLLVATGGLVRHGPEDESRLSTDPVSRILVTRCPWLDSTGFEPFNLR